MNKITVKTKSAEYSVLVERGVLTQVGKTIAKLLPSKKSRCFVVTVAPVWTLWGETFKKALASAKLDFSVLEMTDGERAKSFASVEHLAERMAMKGADRNSVVIAFGGGVVGDLAGFLASVYMRGVPVIQVPTTLLAQVDAAIGGKTGANLRAGKNLVGTFHQPLAVISDPELLTTLPDREFRAGLFEVIKSGVIRDRKLFEIAESERKRLLARDQDILERVIHDCTRIKAEVVAADEKESDLRRILNFGHTIGHALEADTAYRHFLHGEAVGWGMAAAAMIGTAVRRTSPELAQRIVSCVLAYSPLPEVNSRAEDIVKRIQGDKKAFNGKVHFVLATSVGKVEIFNRVPDDVVAHAVEELHYLSRN
ncbi:MAG: 3-dehydroquinate synthase [Acidobacteria bacterium]|nr:MAG: 3-dehydroquinate synthase [Acidobacteriota bacterium]PYY23830.1 MAG: 3-dehydroquinate synthase [Acidobacteriota bacterium]